MTKVFTILVATSIVLAAPRRPYRYNLDPLTAEQLLASLIIKPRLSDKEWKDLLTAKLKSKRGLASGAATSHQSHRVTKGESLWAISGKTLGTPWYWPKIWASNPAISNPHDIEIGRMLAYYREGGEEPTITIPLIRLVPGGKGRATSLETDTLVSQDLKNRFRPPVGIMTDEDPILGTVKGSFTSRTVMYVHENIYIEPQDGVLLQPGQKFLVVRKDRPLKENGLLGRKLADLVRYGGEIEIIRVEEDRAVAQVTNLLSSMRRGDLVVSGQGFLNLDIPLLDPPDDLEATVLAGDEVDYALMGQGQILFVNRGTEDGMKVGHKFRILRDTDPVTKSKSDVKPDFKAEVMVIFAAKNASIGLVIRNEEPIVIGDILLPAQKFANRPPPPRRPIRLLEVD
ncbi:MAG: LysM peptidoglycan-binding domain-containing protein [Deltaproteobacteria bacterium]|nr:LysM peptidoglycan-binding domain-containing protein [Deltaproteobacteria bacterium]MBI3294620.1 LysM peptidoglycan-binding domain-containing protein [Deltaproteobacteria bacterium]